VGFEEQELFSSVNFKKNLYWLKMNGPIWGSFDLYTSIINCPVQSTSTKALNFIEIEQEANETRKQLCSFECSNPNGNGERHYSLVADTKAQNAMQAG